MKSYIRIYPVAVGMSYSSFDLYLYAGSGAYYTQYRFVYEKNPFDPSLHFGTGPNDPSNREFYRIRKAYVGKLEGETFVPCFRALSGGEIGFAFREVGAGDFVGGIHGDEVMTRVKLLLDGTEMPLNAPYFGSFEDFCFEEDSEMYRCNTPHEKLIRHSQKYTANGERLCLEQDIEWIADGKMLQKAYTPMLTAQRLDPDRPETVLSDTVEFYGADGTLLTSFDTSAYGRDGGGKSWDTVCENTPATRVKVYGRKSGFCAEAGYTVLEESIPREQINTDLCIRYMKGAWDNKIYFDVGGGIAPAAGMHWRQDIFYRITYHPQKQ